MAANNRRTLNTTSSSIQRVLRNFADHTSLHGVPRIIHAQSLTARIFWSMICICAFSTFLYSCSNLLNQYFSYPKKVNVEIIQSPVKFPSVTVCNTGHLDMLVVDRIEKYFDSESEDLHDSDSSLDEFFEKYTVFQSNAMSFFLHYPDRLQESKGRDMIEISSRLGLVANVGQTLASSAGIQAKDFIMQCQFLGKSCNVSQSFVKHFDPYFFNCFTFNPQREVLQLASCEFDRMLMSRHFAASFVESNNLENLASAFGMISISLFVPEIDVLPINSNHLVRPTMVNVGVSSFVAVNWRIVGVLHFLPLYVLGFVYQCKKA